MAVAAAIGRSCQGSEYGGAGAGGGKGSDAGDDTAVASGGGPPGRSAATADGADKQMPTHNAPRDRRDKIEIRRRFTSMAFMFSSTPTVESRLFPTRQLSV